MRRIGIIGLGAALTGAFAACGGSGTKTSGGQPNAVDGGTTPSTGTTDGGNGHTMTNADAAAAGPERLLVTYAGSSTSETVVFNVSTKAVDGRLSFPSLGMTSSQNSMSPFLLEQVSDVVAELNAAQPWNVQSSWSTAMSDSVDGGAYYSDPVQVIVGSPKNAYILRYQRNNIAVFDPSSAADGGSPMSSVDLSSFVQAGDSDGLVEMTAGAYVASSNRLYVVLANINQDTEVNGAVICSNEVSTVVAIDTTNNSVASLGGSGPKGSIALKYYNPISAAYDATGNRLIVVSAGCNASGSGGADAGSLGTATRRGIEAVDLASGASTSLLDLDTATFPAGFVDLPSAFVYVDSTHAILQFDSTGQAVYNWNPTQTTVGVVIPNAPDVFAYDGNGNILGTRLDSTTMVTSVVSVAIATGASTTLATSLTSITGASYTASVDVWPHP